MSSPYVLHAIVLLLVISCQLIQSSSSLSSLSPTFISLNADSSSKNDVIVVLQGSHSISKQINNTRTFQQWLTQKDTIQKILSVNPAMSDIKMITPTLFKSRLRKMSLPGFEIEQSLLFEIHINNTAIVLSARKGTVEQRFKGSKMLVNFFSKLTPSDVISSTTISLNIPHSSSHHSGNLFQWNKLFKKEISSFHVRNPMFASIFRRRHPSTTTARSRRLFALSLPSIGRGANTNSSYSRVNAIPTNQQLVGTLSIHESVAVSLRLPSWLPSPKRLVATTGSKSIQKTITRNIKVFADNILLLYQTWERQQV